MERKFEISILMKKHEKDFTHFYRHPRKREKLASHLGSLWRVFDLCCLVTRTLRGVRSETKLLGWAQPTGETGTQLALTSSALS